VAIYGVNLAAEVAAAPAGKLAQKLEHVSVRVGGQVVPLFFVSPGQINVQLPSNLVDGAHTLTVHLEGKPEASEPRLILAGICGLSVAQRKPQLFRRLSTPRWCGITRQLLLYRFLQPLVERPPVCLVPQFRY
jgi:uncharacterized protein (TIGR03437 family)